MMMNAAQVKTTESMILYRTSYSIYDSGFQTPYPSSLVATPRKSSNFIACLKSYGPGDFSCHISCCLNCYGDRISLLRVLDAFIFTLFYKALPKPRNISPNKSKHCWISVGDCWTLLDVELAKPKQKSYATFSGVATGGRGLGAVAPHFCQDGARDFLKIDEKLGVGSA